MAVRFNFDFDRALATIVYLASKNVKALDTYKACKLVFLSDKLHLVRFGRPITGDDVRAMDFGPVPSAVYDLLKGLVAEEPDEHVKTLATYISVDKSFQYPRFSLRQKTLNVSQFLSRSEIEAIDEVAALHGGKSFDELYSMTHAMPAYKNAWEADDRNTKNPLMSFEDMFLNDSEALAGAKEDMIEDFEIRQALRAVV